MFHKFEQAITDLTQGTIGSFCVRCHQQVGTQRGEKRWLPLWERSRVAREGITCITCHRVKQYYGKVNGERHIEPGTIHNPVYGTGRDGVYDETVKRKDELKIATGDGDRGTKIHSQPIVFETLGKSEFCVSCHQVAVNLGIKLEVVWDQYRDSPAFKNGVTCQDCHMGKVPGVAAGYETGPSAVVNGVEVNPNRRHSNHAFYGPGYPIAHPGIFPHNPDAENWDIEDWLTFNYRAEWGSDEFEERVEDVADAFDELNQALETVGGDSRTLAALDHLETALSRGTLGFHTDRARQRLLERLEPLEEVSFDDADMDAIEEALETVSEAVEELDEAVAEKVEAVASATGAIEGRLAAGGAFEDARQAVSDVIDGLPGPAAEEQVDKIKELTSKLRDTIPGADAAFQAALKDLKTAAGVDFPYVWSDPDDRAEAWEVVAANLERLEEKRELRRQVMENGSRIDGPFFDSAPSVGADFNFKYTVTNTDDGHNLPSGSLGAQPEIWLNVALTDPDGNNIWESGYVDSNGDFADVHSLDLAAGTVEFDDQLFNLQTKFLTTNVKGTDREMYLPVNFDLDQRPLLRPANVPTTILNHAPFVRMEGRSLPPLGSRDAEYEVPGELLTRPGKYRLSVRLRSRAEPIYFMKFVGATDDMIRSMNQWMLDIHPYTVEFEVK